MRDSATMSEPAHNLVDTLRSLDGGGRDGVPLRVLTERAAQDFAGLEVEAALGECVAAGWIEIDEGGSEDEPRVSLAPEARTALS